MTILSCFRLKVRAGRVDRQAADKLEAWIESARMDREGRLSAAEAAQQAAMQVASDAAKAADRGADLALRAIEKRLDILERVSVDRASLDALRDGKGLFSGSRAPITLRRGVIPTVIGTARAPALEHALRGVLDYDPHEISTGPNVTYLRAELRKEGLRLFADGFAYLRQKGLLAKAQVAHEHEVLRAVIDRATSGVSDAARQAAEAWTRMEEHFRQGFNAEGGSIPKREGWFPQQWERSKVQAVSRESFKATVKPELDRAAMVDFETGRPLDDIALDRVLDQAHEAIASGGLDGEPSASPGKGLMLANHGQAARVLQFKSADAWARVHALFGPGHGVFETMMRHADEMARDTAQLRLLGPNPMAMRRYMESLFDHEIAGLRGAADAGDAKGMAGAIKDVRAARAGLAAGKARVLNLFDEVTGASRFGGDAEAARFMANARSYLMAGQLGSAILSKIMDVATVGSAAWMHGLPAMKVGMAMIKNLADGSSELRAAQAGVVFDTLAHTARQSDRYMGETLRSGQAARISNGVLKASGLFRWDAAGRSAIAMEMMAQLANRAKGAFAELPRRTQGALRRVGISEAGWEVMRRATAWEPSPGAPFLRPADVRALGPEAAGIASSYDRLLETMMDHAIIQHSASTRAFLFGGTRPGTLAGEATRAIGMYKQFPVTMIRMSMAPAFARGFDGTRMSHFGLSLISVALFGTLAMQAKQIAMGRDPLSLDAATPEGRKNWARGLFQSGGLGLFGDVLAQGTTSWGNTAAELAAGPLAAAAGDLGSFVKTNVRRLQAGQPTAWGGDALTIASHYLPGSSLWYARLALQRQVFDQLHMLIDDRAPERFQRMESTQQTRDAQRFWWRPGQTAPARAPDLAAIGGQR